MKEEFKKFVQKNPQLVDYVNNKKMTWQQFYEMYDLYGEDNSIWNNFKNNNTNNTSSIGLVSAIKEFLSLFKGIDLNTVQKTLTSLDKAIEAFKGFNGNNNTGHEAYEERPQYKYFED